MKSFFRKLRGVLSMGLTWGTLWGLLMFITGVIIGIVDPDSIDPGESPLLFGAILGGMGLVSGALFGLLFSVAERRKKIRELSVLRAAGLGAVAAAAPLLLTPAPDGMVVILCPLGAAFAAGSIALARRADRRVLEPLTLGDSQLLPK